MLRARTLRSTAAASLTHESASQQLVQPNARETAAATVRAREQHTICSRACRVRLTGNPRRVRSRQIGGRMIRCPQTKGTPSQRVRSRVSRGNHPDGCSRVRAVSRSGLPRGQPGLRSLVSEKSPESDGVRKVAVTGNHNQGKLAVLTRPEGTALAAAL